MTLRMAAVAVLAGVCLSVAVPLSASAAPRPGYSACRTSHSAVFHCVWAADVRGNHRGRSFVVIRGGHRKTVTTAHAHALLGEFKNPYQVICPSGYQVAAPNGFGYYSGCRPADVPDPGAP